MYFIFFICFTICDPDFDTSEKQKISPIQVPSLSITKEQNEIFLSTKSSKVKITSFGDVFMMTIDEVPLCHNADDTFGICNRDIITKTFHIKKKSKGYKIASNPKLIHTFKKKCLAIDENNKLTMVTCDSDDKNQMWKIQKADENIDQPDYKTDPADQSKNRDEIIKSEAGIIDRIEEEIIKNDPAAKNKNDERNKSACNETENMKNSIDDIVKNKENEVSGKKLKDPVNITNPTGNIVVLKNEDIPTGIKEAMNNQSITVIQPDTNFIKNEQRKIIETKENCIPKVIRGHLYRMS